MRWRHWVCSPFFPFEFDSTASTIIVSFHEQTWWQSLSLCQAQIVPSLLLAIWVWQHCQLHHYLLLISCFHKLRWCKSRSGICQQRTSLFHIFWEKGSWNCKFVDCLDSSCCFRIHGHEMTLSGWHWYTRIILIVSSKTQIETFKHKYKTLSGWHG